MHQGSVQHMGRRASCGKLGHFKKVCWSRKDRAVHEVEVNVSHKEGKIEEVSINNNNKG